MLSLSNIYFAYSNENQLFSDLSYNFYKDTIYVILGKNGAGKTTLLKIILGVLKSKGTISLNEETNRTIINTNLSFSNDEPHYFDFLTGNDWINFVFNFHEKSFSSQKLKQLLEMLKFNEYHKFISSYSSGMKKKLSLLTLFLLDKKLMLIDESFSALDPFIQDRVLNYMESIKSGKIIIITTHSRDIVNSLSTKKLLYLDEGKLIKLESFEDVYSMRESN